MSECPSQDCCNGSPLDEYVVYQPPVPKVWNTQRCKTASCPAGTTGPNVTKCVAANTYYAGNLTDANALADAAALALATEALVCVPDSFLNTQQSYTASCVAPQTGPDVTRTVPAGTYSAATQAEADALALAAATAQAIAALTCNTNITAALSGLVWKLPNASTTDPNDQVATITGNPGQLYNVEIQIRGIVEIKAFNQTSGAVIPGTNGLMWNYPLPLPVGAVVLPTDYINEYSLEISDPPQVYFLNNRVSGLPEDPNMAVIGSAAGSCPPSYCYPAYTATVQMRTGATVTLRARLVNGSMYPNPTGATIVGTPAITGPPEGVTQPYVGQFLQMDVLSIT